jgi:hypothetical protein
MIKKNKRYIKGKTKVCIVHEIKSKPKLTF